MISAGMVTSEGLDVFISVTNDLQLSVNFFSISTGHPSTGHWIFDSSKMFCKYLPAIFRNHCVNCEISLM